MTASEELVNVNVFQVFRNAVEVHTFMTSAAATADPHEGIQERVPFIARLHAQVDAVLVAAGVDAVSHVGIVDLFQYIFGACEPSFRFDDDECWRFVSSLEQVVGANVGSRVLGNDLSILTAGLFHVLEIILSQMQTQPQTQTQGVTVTHQDNSLAPSTSPLTTKIRNPLPVTPNTGTDANLRVQLDAHTEVQFQSRRGDLQRSRDIAFGECMQQVVSGDGVLHDTKVGRAFE